MRHSLGLVAILSILGGALPMSAQQPTGSFSAFTPRTLNFQAVNPGPMIAPMSLANTMRTPSKQQSFSLANVFHNITPPTWPFRTATAPVLPASQNSIQPIQYPGLNFFPTSAQYPTTNNPYIIHKAWN